MRKLLDPPLLPPIHPGRAGGKPRAANARIEVDLRGNEWAAEELGGGGGNPRGSWFTEAVDVNAVGGSMRRTALHGACANGRLDVVKVCSPLGEGGGRGRGRGGERWMGRGKGRWVVK